MIQKSFEIPQWEHIWPIEFHEKQMEDLDEELTVIDKELYYKFNDKMLCLP